MGIISLFRSAPYVRGLSTPLLRLSKHDYLRAGDFFENVFAFGSSGSGKTSGSGLAILKSQLRAGWGGLILCAKPDEAARIRAIARAVGRERSLVVVDGSGRHRFNLLQYQMETSPDAGGLVMNVVATLTTVIAAMNGQIGGGGSENQFWQKSMKEALTHGIAVLWAAYGRINLYDLFALLQSRPLTYDQVADPKWLATSFMAQTLTKADEHPAHPMHPMDYRSAFTHLTYTLANPDGRTTGNIIATISADLAPLMQGIMRELFCTGTTVVPEMTHHGAIIVLDLPVKVYGEAGLLAQQVFKYLWQKAAEARPIGRHTRPLFQYADEAHLFLSPYDAEFLSTSRSARCATTFISQNYPMLVSKIGGAKPEHTVDALLGNFQTKIFHANGCSRTNQWAAETISRGLVRRYNVGANVGWSYSEGDSSNISLSSNGRDPVTRGNSVGSSRTYSESGGQSLGYSEQMDYQVQPAVFTRLRKGGRVNRGMVDAILFQAGRVFHHSGRTYIPVSFRQ